MRPVIHSNLNAKNKPQTKKKPDELRDRHSDLPDGGYDLDVVPLVGDVDLHGLIGRHSPHGGPYGLKIAISMKKKNQYKRKAAI